MSFKFGLNLLLRSPLQMGKEKLGFSSLHGRQWRCSSRNPFSISILQPLSTISPSTSSPFDLLLCFIVAAPPSTIKSFSSLVFIVGFVLWGGRALSAMIR